MIEFITPLGTSAALVLGTLLPIINPLGGAPIFLAMTKGVSPDGRVYLARQVAINAAIVIAIAMLLGSYILAFFGISEAAVRVAGGLMVISFAWQQLNAVEVPSGNDVDQSKPVDVSSLRPRAFYPLSFPLTTGPGCISVAITLGAHFWGSSAGDRLPAVSGAALGIVATSLLIFICYRSAQKIIAWLGETGARVLLRLAAFILLCIGVQILWEGIARFLQQL